MPKKNKRTRRKRSVAKSAVKRKSRRIKAAPKSVVRKKKFSPRFSPKRKRVTSTGVVVGTAPLLSEERRERRAVQSGDLQSLSNRPTANSESVEELLEEGNASEAEAVQGAENALNADQGEVQTHEVPEDDVPQEYLDKDR